MEIVFVEQYNLVESAVDFLSQFKSCKTGSYNHDSRQLYVGYINTQNPFGKDNQFGLFFESFVGVFKQNLMC